MKETNEEGTFFERCGFTQNKQQLSGVCDYIKFCVNCFQDELLQNPDSFTGRELLWSLEAGIEAVKCIVDETKGEGK